MTLDKSSPSSKNIFQKFVEPHASIEDFAERRFASVLATLLLALIPLYFLPEGLRAIIEKHPVDEVVYYIVGVLMLSGAYLFARSPYPRWGSRLTILYFTFLPFVAIIVKSESYTGDKAGKALIWSVPIMLMALILLHPRQVKSVVFFNIAFYLIIPAVWEGLSYSQIFPTLWMLIAVGGLMIVSAFVQGRYLYRAEYEAIQSKKNERRFREIFLGSPVALWEADFSKIKKRLDHFAAEHSDDPRAYVRENPDAMQGAASSIILLDANQAAIDLYLAGTVETLKNSLHLVVQEHAMLALRDGVLSLWEGVLNRPIETVHNTLSGKQKNVVVRFSVRAGYEETWERVNISIEDITERTKQEKATNLLLSIIQEVAKVDTFTASLNKALEILVEQAGWIFGEVWLPNKKEDHLINSGACYSRAEYTKEMTVFSIASQDFTFKLGEGLPGRVWASKKTEWQKDTSVLSKDVYLRADYAKKANLKTTFGAPVLDGGEIVAVLILYTDKVRTIDHYMIDLISAAVIQLGTVLQRKAIETNMRQLASAVDASASSIVITDTDGAIEYVNPAFSQVTGYTKEEALGNNPRVLKSGQHPSSFYQEMWEVLAKGDIWRGEIINKKKNGNLYWEHASISPVQNDDGKVVSYVAVKDDITRVKEAEKNLRNLSRATEQAASGIVITNTEGIIEFANPAALRITGYSAEEFIGETPNLLKSGEHDASFYDELWKTIRKGEVWRGELINRCKDGSYYWESQTISPVKNTQGEITHYVAVKEDITRRKELEQALAIAHEEALVASDMKTQLLANVSHDMRTPLGAILGYTEMLDAGVFEPLNNQQAEATRAIAASSQRLLNFVSDLLNQAQIETGEIILNEVLLKPQQLLDGLGGEISLARTQGLILETTIDKNLPQKFIGDSYWLGQIVHNLLSNAIKFTPRDGEINIRLLRSGELAWKLEVEDNGKGIPIEAQEYIFESFRQVDGSITRELHTGSGLGLSIVNHLVRLMRGEIRLESELGKGSKFIILLPLKEEEI
ncbi:MAG: PAS domain S-box protein [Anaerolineae bacterium]|jgi:PAS domain S-box-containing protein|nr:PAS domain S-box protein [Anaerolineae bacterium]MBT7074487.1 PAS domain S-box protein [Anaerolineae bacterium]MBT7783601.1 PAS domain S-box protein [Anaerolineae bacterium]